MFGRVAEEKDEVNGSSFKYEYLSYSSIFVRKNFKYLQGSKIIRTFKG